MFGSLFGNMEEKQTEMKEKLGTMEVEAEAGDGAVRVKANGLREILNIHFDPNKIDPSDLEQIEDLLLVAINRALELSAAMEAEEAQTLVKDMMPPGFDKLSGLF